ncbi:MAG TPA: hypothetical protein VLN58_02700, partial [Verrucomicrobiae bacterium]|nr:hypothetical protein [Verrucomicrobiae bacterium]
MLRLTGSEADAGVSFAGQKSIDSQKRGKIQYVDYFNSGLLVFDAENPLLTVLNTQALNTLKRKLRAEPLTDFTYLCLTIYRNGSAVDEPGLISAEKKDDAS